MKIIIINARQNGKVVYTFRKNRLNNSSIFLDKYKSDKILMQAIISPQFLANDILQKLFNNTLEPTIDNIKYILGLASSFNYGIEDLSDDAIDFWISLIPHIRKIFLESKIDIKLFGIPSLIQICFISTQIEQICYSKQKKIPDLFKLLEGISEEKSFSPPQKIIELPIIPTIQNDDFITDLIKLIDQLKPVHKFKFPNFDSVVHYSIIISIIYCQMINQEIGLPSFEEFKKRSKYNFQIPKESAEKNNNNFENFPSIDDPFAFVFIRYLFEYLFGVHLDRQIFSDTLFKDIITNLFSSKFNSCTVYFESSSVPFPLKLCESQNSGLLLLFLLNNSFSAEIEYEADQVFHMTPNFLMAYKFSMFLSNTLDLSALFDRQIKSILNITGYVVEKTEPTAQEVIIDKANVYDVSERLDALGSLSVSGVKDGDFAGILRFWCFWASRLLSSIDSESITLDVIVSVIRVCRVAVEFFSAKEESGAIVCVLSRTQSGEAEVEVPSDFPTRALSNSNFDLNECDIPYRSFDFATILRYSLLIAAIDLKVNPIDAIEKANGDFFADKQELENPLLFIVLYYIYEKMFGVTVDRTLASDDVFKEAVSKETVGESLNLLAFCEGKNKIELTKELFEKRDLYLALQVSNAFDNNAPLVLCDKLCKEALFVASYVITNCRSEIENLATRASYCDCKAAFELLKHKECLPLLDDTLYHSLLRIFLSDEEPTFNIEPDFVFKGIFNNIVTSSAKLFICAKKFKLSSEILVQILKKCYFQFIETPILKTYNDEEYLSISGVYKCNDITIFEKEEDFFPQKEEIDVLSYFNTIIFIVISKLKEEEHPELVHYYSDFASHSLISPKIKKMLPKPEVNRRAFWFLNAFVINANRKAFNAQRLDEIPKEAVFPLYQYLLLKRQTNSLFLMLSHSCCSDAVKTIGLLYLHQSLDLFFYSDSKAAINKVIKILLNDDRQFLIKYFSEHLLKYPENATLILNNLKIDRNTSIDIINNFPRFTEPFPAKLIQVIKTLFNPLYKTFLESDSQRKFDDSVLKWSEDENIITTNSSFINLWKETEYQQCEGDNHNNVHVAFNCYTCGMDGSYICKACAAKCHKNHRISYVKKCKFTCNCQRINKCVYSNQVNESQIEANSSANNTSVMKDRVRYPNTSKLINLLIAFSRIKDNNSKKSISLYPEVVSRLSSELNSNIVNRNYNLIRKKSRLSFIEKKKDFINLSQFNSQYNKQHQSYYRKRCSYLPLRFAEYACGHIFVAVGKKLNCYNSETYELVKTIDLNEEVVSVKASQLDEEYLILTAANSVVLIKSSTMEEIGTFKQRDYNENDIVIQAEIPIPNRVVIVGRITVQVYEISNHTPASNPVEYYIINYDFITSSVFVKYDGNQYGIFALNNGKIVLQVLGNSRTSKTKPDAFNTFSSLPSNFVAIYISYSKEANLFFIAAPGASTQYTPLYNIFSRRPRPPFQFKGDSCLRHELSFYSTYPGVPSILLFLHPNTNTFFSLEYVNDGTEMSTIETQKGSDGIVMFENRFNLYSLIRTPSELLMVSPSGSLMSLYGTNADDEQEETDACYDEYKATTSLFTLAEIATEENAEIVGTDNSQNYNTLFKDSVAFFHVPVDPKIMKLVLRDDSYSIIGFVLTFSSSDISHRPSYLSVFGRKYNCLHDFNIVVALKPNEVKPGKNLEIEFSNTSTSEISMQGIKIFIVKTEKIRPFLNLFESNYGKCLKSDLLDWNDAVKEPFSNAIESMVFKISTSICKDVADENNGAGIVDKETFLDLVNVIYTNKKVAAFARSALVRSIMNAGDQNKKSFFELWAQRLKELIVNNEIDEELWKDAWSDYMLFPQDVKEKLSDVIWNGNIKIGSAESIFSAFSLM